MEGKIHHIEPQLKVVQKLTKVAISVVPTPRDSLVHCISVLSPSWRCLSISDKEKNRIYFIFNSNFLCSYNQNGTKIGLATRGMSK